MKDFRRYGILFAVAHLWCLGIAGAAEETARGKVQFDCAFLVGEDVSEHVIEVTYRNVGETTLFFRPPKVQQQFYRGLRLFADGAEVPFLYDTEDADHFHFPDRVVIDRGAEMTFLLQVDSIWRLPKTWQILDIQHRGVHSPCDRRGAAWLANADEKFVFTAAGARRKADGQVGSTRRSASRRARVEFSCTLAGVESDGGANSQQVIAITYRNVSTNSILFRPPLKATSYYRGVRLIADGQPVPFRVKDEAAALYLFSEEVTIPPATQYTFRIALSDIWDMPQDWQVLTVARTGLHAPVDQQGRPVLGNNEESRLTRTVRNTGNTP